MMAKYIVLFNMISVASDNTLHICIQEPLLRSKKIIVLYQHIKAYSSAHSKVYSSDPRKCLCTQPEGMLRSMRTLVLIQHHVERIL